MNKTTLKVISVAALVAAANFVTSPKGG